MMNNNSKAFMLKQRQNVLNRQLFIRNDQSFDLTLSQAQQKVAIQGILAWLNENLQQMSSIGKNLIVRYNWKTGDYKCPASKNTVRLDYQGKTQGKQVFSRFYIQQDQVNGKTNLAQIYISDQTDKLIQKVQQLDFLSVFRTMQIPKSKGIIQKSNKKQLLAQKNEIQNRKQEKQQLTGKQILSLSMKVKIQVLEYLDEFSKFIECQIVQKSHFSPVLKISIS